MSFTIILSHARGLLSDAERDEWFTLAHGVGLTIDHPALDNTLLHESVKAIEKTRDGKQRFVLAGPYGECCFANDIVSSTRTRRPHPFADHARAYSPRRSSRRRSLSSRPTSRSASRSTPARARTRTPTPATSAPTRRP
jgi:hypothetical protein